MGDTKADWQTTLNNLLASGEVNSTEWLAVAAFLQDTIPDEQIGTSTPQEIVSRAACLLMTTAYQLLSVMTTGDSELPDLGVVTMCTPVPGDDDQTMLIMGNMAEKNIIASCAMMLHRFLNEHHSTELARHIERVLPAVLESASTVVPDDAKIH